MPWKECHVVDERLRFVARLLDGEKMAGLCEAENLTPRVDHRTPRRYRYTLTAPYDSHPGDAAGSL
jgi:hypothetical protein